MDETFKLMCLALAGVSCLQVSLKAFQTMNFVHHKFLWSIVTSYCLSFCEVVVVSSIVASTASIMMVNNPDYGKVAAVVLSIGTGSSMGVVMALVIHKRLRKGKENV